MRGSGKTAVGRALAAACGASFRDADAELERRSGRRIVEVFATEGEAAFRALELPVLLQLLEETETAGTVLATGGGAVLHPAVREQLRAQTHRGRPVVWLTASLATLVARIAASERPRLTDKPLAQELATLFAEREPLYAACATHSVETSERSVDDVVAELRRLLG